MGEFSLVHNVLAASVILANGVIAVAVVAGGLYAAKRLKKPRND